jgi:signal transduction histidine kinase
MVQQERSYLRANAEAIAQQAVPFMLPVQMAPPLQQLAQTAAFLGDVSVRIVDKAQMPVADSGATASLTDAVGTAASPVYFTVSAQKMPQVWALTMPALPAREPALGVNATYSATKPSIGQQTEVIVVQKSPSIWGDRLIFQRGVEAETATITQAMISQREIAQVPSAPAGPALPVAAPVQVDTTMVDMKPDVVKDLQVKDYEVKIGEVQKPLVWDSEVAKYTKAAQPTFLQSADLQSTDMVTAPIAIAGRVAGFVELGRMTDLVNEPLGALRQALAIAAGASALLAIAGGLVMSRTLTTPIQNLAQATAAMSSGDLTARAPVTGRDELAVLAQQFNQMADALHHTIEELAAERDTLRRFVADASHELRTPITALRTFNELLQGPAREDGEAYSEFMAESEAQIARLEWITRNLLDLSRWDGGMARLALAEVEIGELVENAAAPFRARAQEQQIALHVAIPQAPVVAMVDEQRLAMAVGNLLDNALKFTPCAGKVEVGVCQSEGGVTIWVEDTGIGIAAEELPHIFERFYRSPRATQNGSGLGLAIVERIVQAHGATIHVESAEGAGSRFTVYIGKL